jgi:glycerol-3-phosphate dehydrogenase
MLLAAAGDDERQLIGNTQFCLAECRWAARHESVLHLDDLLLRRTRLGSLLEKGGEAVFPALESICREELNWDTARWQAEVARYREIWRKHYYLPTD